MYYKGVVLREARQPTSYFKGVYFINFKKTPKSDINLLPNL